MEQLETLRRKLKNARELSSVVKTMKTLAAVNIRQYQKAVDSLQQYYENIETGLQVAMRNKPERVRLTDTGREEKLGAVVFGSEQGMVGRFNEQIAEYTRRKIDQMKISQEDLTVLALGDKLIGRLESLDIKVDQGISVFGSMVDVNRVNQEVLIRIEEWRLEHHLGRIILLHNRPSSGTTYTQAKRDLLPLNRDWLYSLRDRDWPTRMLPAHYTDWEVLFSALLKEYFFVTIYRASVESLASENASRLSSMQAAEKNIQERLEDLDTRYQHQRQEAITSELLDIVSGFEVLSS